MKPVNALLLASVVAELVMHVGTAVAAGPAPKGDITQIIAGAGVSVAPDGNQTGPVTIGVTKAPDAELLDGVNSTEFSRATASGTITLGFNSNGSPITLPLTGVQLIAACSADFRLGFEASLFAGAGAGEAFNSMHPSYQPIMSESNLQLTILKIADDPYQSQQFGTSNSSWLLDISGKTVTVTAGATIWETAGGGQPAGCTLNWQATETYNTAP